MNDPNLDSPEGAQFEEDHLGVVPADPTPEQMEQSRREAAVNTKLRVAFSTSDRMHAPKPTGVHFVSGRGDVKQAQMIFDDGSVRNPFKTSTELSGRQRRKMAKKANRQMRRTEAGAMDIRDVFKGRQRVPAAVPQEVTTQGEPTDTTQHDTDGTSVAS